METPKPYGTAGVIWQSRRGLTDCFLKPHCFPGSYLAGDQKKPHKHISLYPLRRATLCSFLHNNPSIAKVTNPSPAVPGSPLPWAPPSLPPSLDRLPPSCSRCHHCCPGQQPRAGASLPSAPLSPKNPRLPVPVLLTSLFPPSPASKRARSPLYWPHLCFVLLLLHLLPILTPHGAPPAITIPQGSQMQP